MTHRISLSDNPLVAISKMAADNAGAYTVMSELMRSSPAAIMWLDQLGIYGSHIWTLYRTACKSNIKATVGALQAARKGMIAPGAVLTAADGYVEFTEQQLKQFCELLDQYPPSEY